MLLGLTEYLGLDIRSLLEAKPFSSWNVVRSLENEPTHEVWYEFDEHGVEVICDGGDQVKTIFLRRGGDGESLVGISFTMGRGQVLQRFGTPEKSGDAASVPGIGSRGAWDRFTVPEAVLHIEYCKGRDEIELVTLMRTDVAP